MRLAMMAANGGVVGGAGAVACFALAMMVWLASPLYAQRFERDAAGGIEITPLPVPAELTNPWPAAWEVAFGQRANRAVAAHSGAERYGNTFFENEKRSYPLAMFDLLAGNRAKAVAFLEKADNRTDWNRHTEGIDFFPSFTLKQQMRKYFFFGDTLTRGYRQRMKRGGWLWTQQEPYGRDNPAFKDAKRGWTPEAKNSWVDVRNTDNLRAMRETSVYLMAEEAGSAEIRLAYKRKIQRYVWSLYHIGQGEWDSENYLGHTFAAYLNLYDFAKDDQVKAMAKAALDWMSAAAAVKYYRGWFAGPSKRDYGHPYPYGGSAAGLMALYFGDCPIPDPDPPLDAVHVITSAYRPPAAVVALARKNLRFPDGKPITILASKPPYETWRLEGNDAAGAAYPAPGYQDAAHKPAYFETFTFGPTFVMGSLARGSREDINGLKLLLHDERQGAAVFAAAATGLQQEVLTGRGRCQIAQHGNVLICLTDEQDAEWTFLMPRGRDLDIGGEVAVVAGRAGMSLRLINVSATPVAAQDTSPVVREKWKQPSIMTGQAAKDAAYSGFVLVVDGDLDAAAVDVSQLREGLVSCVAGDGTTLRMQFNPGGLPRVWRNGEQHDWRKHWPLYQPAQEGDPSPITLGWKEGKLRVEAGGKVFEGVFGDDGAYQFVNE